MKGRDERRALKPAAFEQSLDALAHLLRGLVREGDGEDVVGRDVLLGDEVGDANRDDARLPRPRAREYEQRPFGRLYGLALPLVKCRKQVGHEFKVTS